MISLKSLVLIGSLFSVFSYAETMPVIIDVRTPAEYQGGHAPDSINIEFGDIAVGIRQYHIDETDTIYLYCGSGKRAESARQSLLNAGFDEVINLGGLQQALEFSAKPN